MSVGSRLPGWGGDGVAGWGRSLGEAVGPLTAQGEGDVDDGPEGDTWIRTRGQERIGPSKWRHTLRCRSDVRLTLERPRSLRSRVQPATSANSAVGVRAFCRRVAITAGSAACVPCCREAAAAACKPASAHCSASIEKGKSEDSSI